MCYTIGERGAVMLSNDEQLLIMDVVRQDAFRVLNDGTIETRRYAGSSLGLLGEWRVKPLLTGRLKHPRVVFSLDGLRHAIEARYFIFIALKGRIPMGSDVVHLDGNFRNLHPDNLVLG